MHPVPLTDEEILEHLREPLSDDLCKARQILEGLEYEKYDCWGLDLGWAWWFHETGKSARNARHFVRARADFAHGFRKAHAALKQAVKPTARGRAECLQCLTACLRLRGKLSNAERVLEKASSLGLDSRGLRSERGWLWNARSVLATDASMLSHAKKEAATAFERALDLDDKSGKKDDDYIWSAQCWREAEDFDRAEKLLAAAVSRFGINPRLSVEYGWLFFHRRDFSAAMVSFEFALQGSPHLDTALQGKIAVLRELDSLDVAEAILDTLPSNVKSVPGLQSERAWISLARGKPKEASAIFRSLIGQFPADGDQDSDLAKAREQLNLSYSLLQTETKAAWSEAVSLSRPLAFGQVAPQALGCLGVAAFKNKNLAADEYYLKRSIEVGGKSGWHADLIRLYTVMRRFAEADELLTAARRTKPNEVALLAAASQLYLERGDFEGALEVCHHWRSLTPLSSESLIALSSALLQSQETEAAEALLRSAIPQMDPSKTSQVRSLLVRILLERFDETDDQRFLDEALAEFYQNKQRKHSRNAFIEGVIRFKQKDYHGANSAFARSIKNSKSKHDDWVPLAQVNAERLKIMLAAPQAAELVRHGGFLVAAVGLIQIFFVWQSWVLPSGERWFSVPASAALLLLPLAAGMMIAGLSLPYLTRFSVSGVQIELVTSDTSSRPEGPKGNLAFDQKPRGGGLSH